MMRSRIALAALLVISLLAWTSPAAARPKVCHGRNPACTPATPTPTPAATPTPTPQPSATPPAGWGDPIFVDEFDQAVAAGDFPSSVSTRWYAYPYGWPDTSHNGTYDPSIVSVHDGRLDAWIRTTDGIHRVAAFGPVLPGGSKSQLYGRWEITFRADLMRGYKGAWLLWPASEVWPRDGEIDFPEGDFDSTIKGYVHHQGATTGSDQDGFTTSARWTDWHTAVTEWTPGLVVFRLDGVEIGRTTTRVPNTPMRLVLQNETTLAGFEPADSVAGHIEIERVAVWSYAP